MSDTPASLLAEMDAFGDAWEGAERPDWEEHFGDRVRALDQRELFDYVFSTFGDATLSYYLNLLRFAWRDVPYRVWLDVLSDVAADPRQIYFFLWFAAESLGLDIHRLPVFDANIQRELERETFRDGGPHPVGRREREITGDTVDYEAMWDRLAAEGAPMRVVPPGEPDRHSIVF
jgi:hypothetical protein